MTGTGTKWGAWADEVRDDPYPFFAQRRAECPVQHVTLADGHGAWVVLGYEQARTALNDPRISKNMVAAMTGDPDVVSEGLPGPDFAHHMLAVDGADHTRLRRLVAKAFTPSAVAQLEPAVEHQAQVLLDGLAAAGPETVVDLVAGFAGPFPFAVIGELLGIPEADRPALQASFKVLLSPWAGDPPADVVEASDAIVGYLREMVERKRREPDEALTSLLVQANQAGELDELEVLSSLFQLFVAGHDTTTSLIGSGVVALLDDRTRLDAVVADRDLLPSTIEELLRFTAPVPHATFRFTTEVVELAGVEIPAGEQILVSLGAANRDPDVIADPDRFDPERTGPLHVGFGFGSHYCLGAPLARMEARVAFGALVSRFPMMRLAVPRASLAWSHGDGLVLRGLAALPLVLGPDHGGRIG